MPTKKEDPKKTPGKPAQSKTQDKKKNISKPGMDIKPKLQ